MHRSTAPSIQYHSIFLSIKGRRVSPTLRCLACIAMIQSISVVGGADLGERCQRYVLSNAGNISVQYLSDFRLYKPKQATKIIPPLFIILCFVFFFCGTFRYSYGHGSAKMSLVRLAEALGWEPTAVVRELRRCTRFNCILLVYIDISHLFVHAQLRSVLFHLYY